MHTSTFSRIWRTLSLALVSLVLFVACSNGDPLEDNHDSATSVTGDVTTLYITGAKVSGYVNVSDEVLVNAEFGILCSETPGVNIDNCYREQSSNSLEANKFEVSIYGLAASTKYFYRSYTRIGNNYVYGDEKSFTTREAKATATLVQKDEFPYIFDCTTNLEDFDLIVGESENEYGLLMGKSADFDAKNCVMEIESHNLEDGHYSVSIGISDVKPNTTYYYCAYTLTDGKYTYSKVSSFTTTDYHECVDLGLPSGTLWATCNVGAESPEEYGDYFAWGEVEPKSIYNESTYKYRNGSDGRLTKYCTQSDYGTVDSETELDLEDDAAYMNWGEGWRMPSVDQFTELCTKCAWVWTTENNVYGLKVVGQNGNSLFLPAAGGRSGDYLYYAGSLGYYWSRWLHASYSVDAYGLYFGSTSIGWNNDSRYTGFAVRPVRVSSLN